MILFINQYKFPAGDAGSERTLYLAQAYQKLGHCVRIICNGYSKCGEVNIYDGVNYTSLRKGNKYLSYLFFVVRLARHLNHTENVEAIVTTCLNFSSRLYLKIYCKHKQIKLIVDAVEWYDPRQFKARKLSLSYRLNNYNNTTYVKKNVRAIAISSYLNNYFSLKNIRTVRIPVIWNQSSIPFMEKDYTDKLRIQYAGSFGKKDFLKNMLEGILLLNDAQIKNIEFNLIGVNKEQVITLLDGSKTKYNRLENCLKIYGRQSMTFVRGQLQKSDFTVLLRDKSWRNVQAGFPTKVVESISYSTPMLMNFTSDLGSYFKDMRDCIEVEGCSPVEYKKALLRALSLTPSQKRQLSIGAKETASSHFDISTYSEELQHIIS